MRLQPGGQGGQELGRLQAGGKLVVETSNRHLDSVFTAAYGTLTPGDYVELSVSDTGCSLRAVHRHNGRGDSICRLS